MQRTSELSKPELRVHKGMLSVPTELMLLQEAKGAKLLYQFLFSICLAYTGKPLLVKQCFWRMSLY